MKRVVSFMILTVVLIVKGLSCVDAECSENLKIVDDEIDCLERRNLTEKSETWVGLTC